MTHTELEAAGPEDVRAYLDDLVARQPEVFERMALNEIHRLRPRLAEDEALSVAYDATQAVVRMSERVPVRRDTVLGLVRRYVRWAALDRLRQVAPRQEVPAGFGHDLTTADGGDSPARPVTGTTAGSLMEDARAAAGLQALDRMGARLRAGLPAALSEGRLRLSGDQARALREAALSNPGRPPGADATARKQLERARAAVVRWIRMEASDEHERLLLALLLGDHLPARERRGREPDLLRALSLDQAAFNRPPGRAAAGRPARAGTTSDCPRSV